MAETKPAISRGALAEDLVGSARIAAKNTVGSLIRRHPILDTFDPAQLDLFVTVASVFLAVRGLRALQISGDEEAQLMRVVARNLSGWHRQALDVFDDCKDFYDRTADVLAGDPKYASGDAVGSWIVWNILRRAPSSDEERSLVRDAGLPLAQTFSDWWDTKRDERP